MFVQKSGDTLGRIGQNQDESEIDKRLDYRYGKRLDYRYGKRLDYRYGKRNDIVDLTPDELAGFIKLTNLLVDLERKNKLAEYSKRLDYRYG